MKRLITIAVLLLLGCTVHADGAFRVIGYSMNPAAPIVQTYSGRFVTDVIFFSVETGPKGEVIQDRLNGTVRDALQQLRENYKVNTSIAVGGWGRGEHFSEMAGNEESRHRFVESMRVLCIKEGFSGIDYDWEHPTDGKEAADYGQLIIETKAAFRTDNLTVTVAIAPWQHLSTEVYAALDRVHLMAYDEGERHSTLEYAKQSVMKMLAQGVPASKIFLGVPFYGRLMKDTGKSKSYPAIVNEFSPKPQDDEAGGYYFNGPLTIAKKTQFAKDKGLGGIMIWEISSDTQDKVSLLSTINALKL